MEGTDRLWERELALYLWVMGALRASALSVVGLSCCKAEESRERKCFSKCKGKSAGSYWVFITDHRGVGEGVCVGSSLEGQELTWEAEQRPVQLSTLW